jgi:hypothetical protein
MPQDIAETILFVVTRPKHVNIDDILVMPTDQAIRAILTGKKANFAVTKEITCQKQL